MSQSTLSSNPQYRGRFAPSPTGPLHFGSLISALASFLQAKSHEGIWLLRVEDLDPPREQPGSIDNIMRMLEQHQLFWDESVVYQSQRFDLYQNYLEKLQQQNRVYVCGCSRKTIQEQQQRLGINVYPGTCRESGFSATDSYHNQHAQYALRLHTPAHTICFDDNIQGHFSQQLAQQVGDFILRRADGWFAYQLAVVVDDAEQDITQIVRGSDLLDNTPRQILLQRLLQLPQPDYAHVPIATNINGEKLSKQNNAPAIDGTHAVLNLIKALEFLGQNPPAARYFDSAEDVIAWALRHWQLQRVPTQISLCFEQ